MKNIKSLQRVDDFSIKIKSIYLDVCTYMDMHTYTHVNTRNTTNSFSVVSTVQQRYYWNCIFSIL